MCTYYELRRRRRIRHIWQIPLTPHPAPADISRNLVLSCSSIRPSGTLRYGRAGTRGYVEGEVPAKLKQQCAVTLTSFSTVLFVSALLHGRASAFFHSLNVDTANFGERC